MWMSRPRLFGQPFMGSPNSNVQAESGPARALNVSCLLFGDSSFPKTALSTPAHKPRPAARGGGPALPCHRAPSSAVDGMGDCHSEAIRPRSIGHARVLFSMHTGGDRPTAFPSPGPAEVS